MRYCIRFNNLRCSLLYYTRTGIWYNVVATDQNGNLKFRNDNNEYVWINKCWIHDSDIIVIYDDPEEYED